MVLPVWMCNSLNAEEFGVVQHCVPALVYIAQDDWVSNGKYPAKIDSSYHAPVCTNNVTWGRITQTLLFAHIGTRRHKRAS